MDKCIADRIASDRKLRSSIRAAAGQAGTAYPVKLVTGSAAPALVGRSWHHVTPGGALVQYPSAYRKAFGKPIYIASTLRVEVGVEWVAALATA